MFLTRREPGVPLSLFRPYPLPFSSPFILYFSLTLLFFYVFFIDLYLLTVVSGEAFYLLLSLLYPYVSDPQGTWSALDSFPTLSSSLYSSFSSILFLTLPFLLSFSLTYICCSFRGGILSAVFPTVAICF